MEEVAWLQLGNILLHVSLAAHTTPVAIAYSLPPSLGHVSESRIEVFLDVKAGLHPSVHLMGHEQSLFPMALRLLWRLCQDAGEVVTHDDLKDALSPTSTTGGMNLPQNITYLRNMFEEALDIGELIEDDLRDELSGRLSDARVADMSRRALLRTLIQSVRGRGYRLNISPDRVNTSAE